MSFEFVSCSLFCYLWPRFNIMSSYITNKFTLIPIPYFNEKEAREVLCELFEITDKEEVEFITLEHINAVLLYSLPLDIKNSSNIKHYPLVNKLLEYLKEISEYNKVIFHFSKESEIVHILISKGNNLELINSYNAKNFTSALYFLLLAIKQTIINSHQTTLHILSEITTEEREIVHNYFKNIEIKDGDKI